MMGDEGRPGKKIKVKGRVKRPERPPENPVVDVSNSANGGVDPPPADTLASMTVMFMRGF